MAGHAPARPTVVAVGNAVHWRGETYLVTALQGTSVHLLSQHADGEDAVVFLDTLSRSPGFAVLATPHAASDDTALAAPQAAGHQGLGGAALLEGLPESAREKSEFWLDHVLEVHTGLPSFAAPGTARMLRPRAHHLAAALPDQGRRAVRGASPGVGRHGGAQAAGLARTGRVGAGR